MDVAWKNGEYTQVEVAAEGVKLGRLPVFVVGTPPSTPVDGGVKSGVVSDSGANGGLKAGAIFDSGDNASGIVDELTGDGAGPKLAGPIIS